MQRGAVQYRVMQYSVMRYSVHAPSIGMTWRLPPVWFQNGQVLAMYCSTGMRRNAFFRSLQVAAVAPVEEERAVCGEGGGGHAECRQPSVE